jgi:uncharacterized protein YqeY
MSIATLKDRITEDMKTAMRAKDSARLGAIRFLQAAIKQREIDERISLDDAAIIGVIEKLAKQRRDSINQFEQAGRMDLADKEKAELALLQAYLPQQMTDDELVAQIKALIAAQAAVGPQAMGKVMGALKPLIAGRADPARASALVKQLLAG